MITRLITQDFPLFLPPPLTPRSEGIHVSSIIRCIATEMGILTPDTAEELSLSDVHNITDPLAILRISMGLAWEEYYIPRVLSHYEVVDHPGEMENDGVYMTHDGEDVCVIITLGTHQIRVHEVKCTYKSTRTVADLNSQWMWLAQMRAYCKAKGTRFAVLHVLFVCGNYTYPIRPMLLVWEIEFTQQEIDDNWDILRDYRDEKLAQEAENDHMRGFGE